MSSKAKKKIVGEEKIKKYSIDFSLVRKRPQFDAQRTAYEILNSLDAELSALKVNKKKKAHLA